MSRDGNSHFAGFAAAISAALGRFCREDGAATAIEYGLIAAMIALVLITTLVTMGSTLNAQYYSAIAAHL